MDDSDAGAISTDSEQTSNPLDDKTETSASFTFVPITGPEAASGRINARHTVRHHVTRIQHARARQTKASNLQWRQTYLVGSFSAKDTEPSRPADRKDAKKAFPVLKRSHHFREIQRCIVSTSSDVQAPLPESVASSPSSHGSYNIALPSPQNQAVGCLATDPFWTLPVAYSSFLPPIFAHYIQNIAVENDEIDDDNEKGLLRKRWFPHLMESAATMYSVLLVAASHRASVSSSVREEAKVQILYLKSRALEEINNMFAAQDVAKPPDDSMIAAVLTMAAYDALFGDSDVFALHMHGLAGMIEARGGLHALGLNGLMEKMIIFTDVNGAHVTGKPCIMAGNPKFATSVSFDALNLGYFTGGIL